MKYNDNFRIFNQNLYKLFKNTETIIHYAYKRSDRSKECKVICKEYKRNFHSLLYYYDKIEKFTIKNEINALDYKEFLETMDPMYVLMVDISQVANTMTIKGQEKIWKLLIKATNVYKELMIKYMDKERKLTIEEEYLIEAMKK